MDDWEAVTSSVDSDMIWACQSSALDHYEKHPSSSNIQENIFESSLGNNVESSCVNGNAIAHVERGRNIRNIGTDSGRLIDIDTSSEDEEGEPQFCLLLRRIDGTKIRLIELNAVGAQREVEMEKETCVMEKGSIVRELNERKDDMRIIDLFSNSNRLSVPVASADLQGVYGVVSESYLAKLTMDDVKLLRPVGIENRFVLYQDFARYAFVRHLTKGDEVTFKEKKSGEMRRGFISKIERDHRGDYSYSLTMPQRGFSSFGERELDGSNGYRYDADYEGNEHEGNMVHGVTAHRLFPPTRRVEMDRGRRRTPSPPRERLIPVGTVDAPSGYALVNEKDLQHKSEDLYFLSGDLHRYSEEQRNSNSLQHPSKLKNTTGSPSREKIIPIRILDSPPGSALIGERNKTEQDTQGPYRNLTSQFNRYTEEVKKPPPTKPRTKFDLDRQTRENLPSLPPTISRSTGREERSSGEGRNYRTDNYPRYAQEEDWGTNQNQPRMNGGLRREEERDKRREDSNATMRLGEYEGWREGDRCEWENDGRRNEATVRWIGRLRGHNSVYAGLQFDEPVGQGTGMYQGCELFNTKANHAGFVMIRTISPLLISTSNAHPSTFHTQNQTRNYDRDNGVRKEGPSAPSAFHNIAYPVHERVGTASPPIDVPISGQGAMIPPRYVESEVGPSTSGGASSASARNRPLPPPPPYDTVPLRPSAPSVPPRPVMLPEDYMIESFDVGSCVDVCHKGAVRSGVVRWKGDAFNQHLERLETSVIVELESSEAPPDGWRHSMETGISGVDHTLSTVIVPLSCVRRDRRFAKDSSPLIMNGYSSNGFRGEGRGQDYGSIDSGVEILKRDPWGGTEELIGRMKGIQGNRNSCYLDSMLYTLFVQCTAFDDILTRRRSQGDIGEYEELVRILSTEIVWPLRRFHYVRADHMMKLRRELEKALPNIKGMTSEEKDPEEILSSLLRDVFKTKPYLNLINSKTGKVESTWLYHVVVEADEWQNSIASSQHLLERSLRKDATKLAECPQVFIMQLPRYGVTKIFDKIVPLEKIDLTPFMNNTVFPCAQCTKNPAELYCHECFLTKEALYGEVSYCVDCFRSVHLREGLADHADRPIPPPSRPSKKMTRYTFTLSGVLAIETSHYVSFVRSCHGRWLFFDSMADREGLENGFNIPQVRECERVAPWLSLNGYQRLRASPSSLPLDDPLVNRLLSDSYICIYTADQPTSTPSNSTTSLLSKLTKEFKISKN